VEVVIAKLASNWGFILLPLVVQAIKANWPGEGLPNWKIMLMTAILSEVFVGGYQITANWPLATALDWYNALLILPAFACLIATGVYEWTFKPSIKAGVAYGMRVERARALRAAKAQLPPE
jgi:hypothetical protein